MHTAVREKQRGWAWPKDSNPVLRVGRIFNIRKKLFGQNIPESKLLWASLGEGRDLGLWNQCEVWCPFPSVGHEARSLSDHSLFSQGGTMLANKALPSFGQLWVPKEMANIQTLWKSPQTCKKNFLGGKKKAFDLQKKIKEWRHLETRESLLDKGSNFTPLRKKSIKQTH